MKKTVTALFTPKEGMTKVISFFEKRAKNNVDYIGNLLFLTSLQKQRTGVLSSVKNAKPSESLSSERKRYQSVNDR